MMHFLLRAAWAIEHGVLTVALGVGCVFVIAGVVWLRDLIFGPPAPSMFGRR